MLNHRADQRPYIWALTAGQAEGQKPACGQARAGSTCTYWCPLCPCVAGSWPQSRPPAARPCACREGWRGCRRLSGRLRCCASALLCNYARQNTSTVSLSPQHKGLWARLNLNQQAHPPWQQHFRVVTKERATTTAFLYHSSPPHRRYRLSSGPVTSSGSSGMTMRRGHSIMPLTVSRRKGSSHACGGGKSRGTSVIPAGQGSLREQWLSSHLAAAGHLKLCLHALTMLITVPAVPHIAP